MTSEAPRSMRELPRGGDALVELVDVSASERGVRGVPGASLSGASVRLGAGLHVVEGARPDGLGLLLHLLSGARAPTSGSVRVGGRDPARDPTARARLGVLGASGELPCARTVGAAVRAALAARGSDGTGFDAVLDPLGLGALHARSPATLRAAELRAVELALALTTPSPLAVVLHEPLLDVAAPTARVLERLELLAQTGTAVLVLVDPRGAQPPTSTTRRRLVRGAFRALEEPPPGGTLSLGFRDGAGGEGARELAIQLSTREGVSGVAWRTRVSDGVTLGSVTLDATDLAASSRALVAAARALELDVISLETSPEAS